MSCCPEGALGQLGTEGYVCKVSQGVGNILYTPIWRYKGKVERVEDLDLYFVGSGSKCIIWNYDIFGFDSGRTR